VIYPLRMAKKTTKTSKKFDLKRSDIVDKLGELIGTLEDLSVHDTSPNDLEETIRQIIGDLGELSDAVTQEAY
jgi:hypothetical protein